MKLLFFPNFPIGSLDLCLSTVKTWEGEKKMPSKSIFIVYHQATQLTGLKANNWWCIFHWWYLCKLAEEVPVLLSVFWPCCQNQHCCLHHLLQWVAPEDQEASHSPQCPANVASACECALLVSPAYHRADGAWDFPNAGRLIWGWRTECSVCDLWCL